MKPRRASATDPTLEEQVVALKEGQRSMRGYIEALDCRLAGMERDLAICRDRLCGQFHIDPEYVAERLNLTRSQGSIAAALAEGSTVRNIADTTGRTENTVRHHVKKIYRRLNISTQTELVRQVLLLPYGQATRRKPEARTRAARDNNPGPQAACPLTSLTGTTSSM